MRVARMNLETGSASLMFLAMAAHLPDYDGLSYQKLSNIEDQYPILGRSDVYYGGTSYENSQGLGVQLLPSSQRGERVALFENPVNQSTLDRMMLYPVTNLYDNGNTLSYSKLLANRIPERYVCVSTVTGEQLNVHSGDKIKIEVNNQITDAVVRIDESISANTILAPRSMGITMCEPVPVKILISETERMRGK
jgi:NADH-quinone oxidoreductase subunit G